MDKVTAEFMQIPIEQPTPVQLVTSNLICNSLVNAARKTLPYPSQIIPFAVNIPPIATQKDAEFTSMLNINETNEKCFETTDVVKQYEFHADEKQQVSESTIVQKDPSQKTLPNNAQKTASVGGECGVQIARPPSASEVRQLAKDRLIFDQQKQTTRKDQKALRSDRLSQMQQALVNEAKQGRKIETLPEGMRYIVSEKGEIIGIGPCVPKQVSEAAKSEVRVKKEDEGAKKKEGKKKEVIQEVVSGENEILEEMGKKYLESLTGKKIVEKSQKGSRASNRK